MSVRFVLNLVTGTACAIMLMGCAEPSFFSLGGTIPTQNLEKTGPRYKANFGGFFDACDLDNPSGHVTYHDKYASDGEVRLEGLVREAAECVDFGLDGVELGCLRCQEWVEEATGEELLNFPGNGYLGYARIRYRSQDLRKFDPSDNGIAYICVADFGEGANAFDDDFLLLNVMTGPYSGYRNFGPVKGNINHHDCED